MTAAKTTDADQGFGATIIRHQSRTWTSVDNQVINDTRLGLKAMGLLVYMLSRPNDWRFYQNQLRETWGEGRDSMRTIMRTLTDCGYVRRFSINDEKGHLRTVTIVSELPDVGDADFNRVTKKADVGLSVSRSSRQSVEPMDGKPLPIQRTDLDKELTSLKTENNKQKTEEEPLVHPQAEWTTPQPPQEKKKQIRAMDEPYHDHLFATFWSHYPRKECKAEAQKAWAKKVIGQVAAEQAIEAIKQRIGINSQEKKFIPLAGTWINKERWKDLDTSLGVYSLFEDNDSSNEETAMEEKETTPPPIAPAPLRADRAQIEALILAEAEEAGDWRILGDARALADEVARRMLR